MSIMFKVTVMGQWSPFRERAAGFGASLERVEGSKMRPEGQAGARIWPAEVGAVGPGSGFILNPVGSHRRAVAGTAWLRTRPRGQEGGGDRGRP